MDVTRNGDDLWEWTVSKQAVNDLVKAQRLVVAEADKLCRDCVLQDPNTLLCSGTRMLFDLEDSENRGVVSIHARQCPKANRGEEVLRRSDVWNRTFLWPNTLAQYRHELTTANPKGYISAKIEMDGLLWTINGEAPPRFSRIDRNLSSAKMAQELVVAHANQGFTACYVNVVDLLKAHEPISQQEFWDSREELPHFYKKGNSWNDNIVRLSGADWVVLTGLPVTAGQQGPDSMLNRAFRRIVPVVEYRLERNLPLTVALCEDDVKHFNPIFKDLLKLITSWDSLF